MAPTIRIEIIVIRRTTVPLACIYHKKQPFRVVSFAERDKLLATGEWFAHPSCKQDIKEEVINHEKPIRQQPRKRSVNGEDSPKSL